MGGGLYRKYPSNVKTRHPDIEYSIVAWGIVNVSGLKGLNIGGGVYQRNTAVSP